MFGGQPQIQPKFFFHLKIFVLAAVLINENPLKKRSNSQVNITILFSSTIIPNNGTLLGSGPHFVDYYSLI